MNKTKFDLLVIGAGPGGYVAAIRAAQLGMRVACIEKEALGGTCLNVGCIPSKALLESSELLYQARTTFPRHGIKTGPVDHDLSAMMKRKDGIVKTMNRGVKGLFRKNKVEHIEGNARLTGPGSVEVERAEGVESVKGDRILIATGSAPVELPDLPFDGVHVLSSTEALSLPKTPERLVVIGAGAIGLELGSVWSRLGSEVLVIELMDHILPGMDLEMTRQLQKSLEKQGLVFQLGARAKSSAVRKGKLHLTVEHGSETRDEGCDHVLVSVGRRPHTEGLGVEQVGVDMDEKGRIMVNENYETNLAGVYAIGDVIPGPMLAHKAEEEGIAAVELMAGKGGHLNYEAIPNVVYTSPELASVGMTEEIAKEKGIEIRAGKFPFIANGRAHALESTEGLVKVISHSRTDRLLGMHILGVRASEIIAEGAVAIEFSASSEDIARSVHAHPTLPEAIKEAALAVAGRGIHI